MNQFCRIILAALTVLGLLMALGALNRLGTQEYSTHTSGGIAGGLLFSVLSVIGFIYFLRNSPERRQLVIARKQELTEIEPEIREHFFAEELCTLFEIDQNQRIDHLVNDIRIAPIEISNALRDLQIDYDLPIGSDDTPSVKSVDDIIVLIQKRLAENPSL